MDNETNSNSRQGGKIYLIVMTIIAVVMTIANVIVVQMYAKDSKKSSNNDEVNEAVNINKDIDDMSAKEIKAAIKKYMSDGTGTITMLRKMYPENVVVYESNKYLFLPILEDVEKNDIIQSNVKSLDNGELQYLEDDKVVSHKGIDVSKYQGTIDWSKVAADGVEYAIIRIGYRGYGTGAIVEDESFEQNIKDATAAGIKVGVYFFSQATNENEAIEEANYIVDKIKDYDIKYPVVFDTEEILNEDARTEGLTSDELTNITVAFCDKIKEAGYNPMIYANLRWYTMSLDMSKLKDYDKWYAYYDKELYFPYKIDMWQYTESGVIDGIEGKVDLNISFKEWD